MVPNPPGQPAFIALFGNTEKTRGLWIMVDETNKLSRPLDDRFVAEFEKGVRNSGGGTRISGKFVQVAGIKSYERLGKITLNGKEASILMRVVPADGKLYSVQGIRSDGNAAEDPEIRAALLSFRFLRTPVQSYSRGSAAYQTGYLAGRIFGFVVTIGVIIAIVLASVRRKPVATCRRPPPVPPGAQ